MQTPNNSKDLMKYAVSFNDQGKLSSIIIDIL